MCGATCKELAPVCLFDPLPPWSPPTGNILTLYTALHHYSFLSHLCLKTHENASWGWRYMTHKNKIVFWWHCAPLLTLHLSIWLPRCNYIPIHIYLYLCMAFISLCKINIHYCSSSSPPIAESLLLNTENIYKDNNFNPETLGISGSMF